MPGGLGGEIDEVTTTKAIYQAFIDAIDRIKERLE